MNLLDKFLQDQARRMLEPLNDKADHTLFELDRILRGHAIYLGNNEAITKIFTGHKMYVNTMDVSVVPHLLEDGWWEPELTAIFRDAIGPDSIVFDIGANFGYFGIIASSKMASGSKGQLHFFEANTHLKSYLFRSLSVNGLLGRSRIVMGAVADKRGEVDLVIPNDLWGSASVESFKGVTDIPVLGGHKIGVHDTVRVPTVVIDEYMKEQGLKKVDVIKMDIEGYEEKAYAGMRKTVKNSPNLKLFIEFSDSAYKNARKFFDQMLTDFGHIYVVLNADGGKLKPVKTYEAMKSLMTESFIMLLASKKPVKQ